MMPSASSLDGPKGKHLRYQWRNPMEKWLVHPVSDTVEHAQDHAEPQRDRTTENDQSQRDHRQLAAFLGFVLTHVNVHCIIFCGELSRRQVRSCILTDGFEF